MPPVRTTELARMVRLCTAGHSLRDIARRVGRDPKTVWRHLRAVGLRTGGNFGALWNRRAA